jgi:hypothetical protein
MVTCRKAAKARFEITTAICNGGVSRLRAFRYAKRRSARNDSQGMKRSSALRRVVRGFFGLGAHAADGAVVAGLRVHELVDGGKGDAVGGGHAEDFHRFRSDFGDAQGAAAEFGVFGEGEFAGGLLALGGGEGIEQGGQLGRRWLMAERGVPLREGEVFAEQTGG